MCFRMTATLPDVSVHFARFEVTQISTGEYGLAQFDRRPMLDAATLLGHAHVGAIVWNGTSGGWLGFHEDVALCHDLTTAGGAPATTLDSALVRVLGLDSE